MARLELSHRHTFRANYLKPALAACASLFSRWNSEGSPMGLPARISPLYR
ncbi:Fic family protein [Pseudomonas sichuanensis]